MDQSEELFAHMKKQFLDDPEGNLEVLRECSANFSQNPKQAIQKALLVLHNMKGSAQAVGFSYFAFVLHDAEEVLGDIDTSDHQLLERLFSQLIDTIEGYFRSLAERLEDNPEFGNNCRLQLKELLTFRQPSPPNSGWGLFDDEPAAPAAPPPPEPEGVAEVAAAVTAAVTTANHDAGKYLLLEQNHRLYAISLNEVKEIISDHYLNPLPMPQKGLRGMIVVRNRALPVMDLGVGVEQAQQDSHICAVICESNNQSFAVRVQKPRQVISLTAKDFENVAEKNGHNAETHQLVKNVANFNGQSVLVVDLKSVTGL